MRHFFWETSPVYLLKQNPQYKLIKKHNIKEVYFLISEYKKTSKEIKNLINDDKQKPFKDYIYQLLDKEAYLSEIAFYLKEFPWIDNKLGKINYLIKNEYLIDYYNKLEFNFQEKENSPIFMVGLLNNSILLASKKRFSKQNT